MKRLLVVVVALALGLGLGGCAAPRVETRTAIGHTPDATWYLVTRPFRRPTLYRCLPDGTCMRERGWPAAFTYEVRP